MTFIASVIAKNGIAVIADSLVTSSRPVLEFEDFMRHLMAKRDKGGKNLTLAPKEIIELFDTKPSHTRDYEEKLFPYDDFTIITTAGNAIINGKRIGELVKAKSVSLKSMIENYDSAKIEENIKDFCQYIDSQIKEELMNASYDREAQSTTFIFAHYNPNNNNRKVFKVKTKIGSKKDMEKESYSFLEFSNELQNLKVTCDGQNRISEMILFGGLNTIMQIAPRLISKIQKDFNIPTEKITADYIQECLEACIPVIGDDLKINQLTELSLQQAVDLATLLMNIEMSFQAYTKDIPTVGGVIKVAVLDDKGFRYIFGNQIVTPKLLR